MDFHWAISWLDGGGPSSCWCCSDDRSASVIFGRGDGAAIGSSCMQKPSSASSESARDGSSSTSAGSASSPANAAAATPPPPLNVRSSDRTNRLEFLRCWSIVRPVQSSRADDDGCFARWRNAFAETRPFLSRFSTRGRGRGSARRPATAIISWPQRL